MTCILTASWETLRNQVLWRRVGVSNFQPLHVAVGYTNTRGLFGGGTELPEVSGIDIEVVPNLQCGVPVLKSY